MGVTNWQVYKTVYNVTERNNKFSYYIPGYYEQEPVDVSQLHLMLKQKTPEYKEKRLYFGDENVISIKIPGNECGPTGSQSVLCDYYLPDLKYELLRKNVNKGLKEIIYGWHDESGLVREEQIDMMFRMQLTIEEIEDILGFVYIEPKTVIYEIPLGIYELTEINNAFAKRVQALCNIRGAKSPLGADQRSAHFVTDFKREIKADKKQKKKQF